MEIINEEVEKEAFKIDNDKAAEWALSKIREEKAELLRMETLCKNMIESYQERLQRANKDFETKTSYLKSQLQQYFETVTPKVTKTQATYTLPSGKLKKKFGTIEYIKDEEKLLNWVKLNGGIDDFIKIKESVKWAELKKALIEKDDKLLTEDGEIVDGVVLQRKPDTFEVEI